MTFNQIISILRENQIRIWLDQEGNLRYKAPAGALNSEISDILKENRTELITHLNSLHPKHGNGPIKKTSSYQNLLPSYAQQGIWLACQIKENSALYNVVYAYEVIGEIDYKRLQVAIDLLVKRHDSLRANFSEMEGDLRLVIQNERNVDIQYEDWLDESSVESRFKNRINAEEKYIFNLASEPLFRVGLVRLNTKKWYLWINIHHIISDGWSANIFFNDLVKLYYNQSYDPVELPSLEIQYADYVVWQRNLLTGERYHKLLGFWKDYLLGAPELTDLPLQRNRLPNQLYTGDVAKIKLEKEITDTFIDYCNNHGITPFMGFLAVYAQLIFRYTGQKDIVVGSAIANRSNPQLYPLIGCFANLLPIRIKQNHELTFSEFMSQLGQNLLACYEHQEMPFDKLADELNTRRTLSHNPIIQIQFLMNTIASEKIDLQRLCFTPFKRDIPASGNYDLALEMKLTGEGYTAYFTFNAELFDKTFIEQFAIHYSNLLQTCTLSPDKDVSQLDFMSEQEKNQLLITFNNTGNDYPGNKTVIELFEEQAKRTPGHAAVIFKETILSYETVSRQVNCLSGYLCREHGIGRNDRVGVMLKRSSLNVISLLGTLKSGGCYVPLDYEYPMSRLMYIIRDSGVKLILTESELSGILGEADSEDICKQVILDNIDMSNYHDSGEMISKPDDSSYIIYTSGSTGKPKGVIQTHAMLSNLTGWDLKGSGISCGLKHLQYASFNFDASLHDVCFALCGGGSVYVVSEELRLEYKGLAEMIIKEGIEVLSFPFSALSNFFNHIEEEDLFGHRIGYIVSTAEQLYVSEKLDSFLRMNPQVELHNQYGPSETHVVTNHRMSYEMTNVVYRPSIGKPVYNTDICILDEPLHLQPIGVRGELYIGGRNLAIGYANMPDQTGERFVAHPFRSGERSYRSGDIGRWLSDGTIEYLGRNDDQIKVRGYRVEVLEVERVLSKYAGVQEVVVLQREDGQGDQLLVAYVVGKEALAITELRSRLLKELPTYMIPDYFIQIEELPLTSNGKVDKKQLPDPQSGNVLLSGNYLAARDRDEEELVRIWQEVLGREQIGVLDNFFEIGGHSLKAMRIIFKIYKELGVQLPFGVFFTNPTVELLANQIRSLQRNTYDAILKVPTQPHYALSHAQNRLWVLDQMDESSVAYNMATAYELRGELDRDVLERCFQLLIERHEILRTTFLIVGGEPRQKVNKPSEAKFTLEYVDLRNNPDKEEAAQHLTEEEALKSFDLQTGPLLRASVVQLEGSHYILLFTMHHIISDGWSMDILAGELLSLYKSFEEGRGNILPHVHIQYKDYAAWQENHWQSGKFEMHEAWWLDWFKDDVPKLELVTDYVRPSNKTYSGSKLYTDLDVKFINQIKEYVIKKTVSPFVLVLTAMNVLLHRYTGQTDIVLGTPNAGRTHPDLEKQIGFYVNTLVLRTKFSGNDTFNSLLAQINYNTISALDHQDYPFNKLVDKLNITTDRSRSPLFDILVQWFNHSLHAEQFASQGIKIKPYRISGSTSIFDLSFHFIEFADQAVHLMIEYNTHLYKEKTVVQFRSDLLKILSEAVQDDTWCIKDFELAQMEEDSIEQRQFINHMLNIK